MASLDSLPPDQRAVLQLVLQRGRNYDQIAAMLSIDRAKVRQRALAAFDHLGPETQVDSERRHLLTDYLLGQLPPRVAQDTRARLASSPSERAWVRVLASELAPIAGEPLPEIPTGGGETAVATPAPAATATATATSTPVADPGLGTAAAEPPPEGSPPARESSRLGGAVLLAIGALVAIVVVAVVLATGNGGSKTSASTRSVPASVSTTGTTTTPTRVVAQINLSSPTGAKTPVGVAQVVKQGTSSGIIIVASGVTPNTKQDAYAVWLSKPGGKSKILGFVNPGVGTTGRLQTAGGLPTDASSYTELLVTRETQASPKTPGTTILQGTLKLG
jgi:hypothetical protein